MNSKKPLVYTLGAAVCCIWGLILFRIFSPREPEGSLISTQGKNIKIRESLPKQFPDTFRLQLNYPDPFTGEQTKVRDTTQIKSTINRNQGGTALPVAIPVNPLDQLKYLGYVADGKGGRRVGIISMGGQERMLKEGDTIQKIKIIKVGKDAVTVSYAGRIKTLKTE